MILDRVTGGLLAAAVVLAAVPAWSQMTLPGKFEVTDTGSASYTIPISVVPGTAGLEPKLSLQYDSRGGNGLLGVGWSLSGLPAITRCGRTIAQDGTVGGVSYDANDRFCLDGQRLIAISGTYGADQTEYRTERESFSKIVSYGTAGSGPAWFKVWTKAGLIMEFGNTADSRIEAQGKASARVWAINRTSDTKGNWFSVSYTEDNANGEYRPSRIDYTGNGSTAPANSVRFVYETRPDIIPMYQAGSLIKTTQRMTRVQAWQGGNNVREYRMAYATGGQFPRLISVIQCGDACLPAAEFSESGSGVPGIFDDTLLSAHLVANVTGSQMNIIDLNGDGIPDQLVTQLGTSGWYSRPAFGNGDGTFTEPFLNTHLVTNAIGAQMNIADLNGDGIPDQLVTQLGTSGWYSRPAFGKGDGTFAEPTLNTHLVANVTGSQMNIVDLNGDGIPDQLVTQLGTSGWYSRPALGKGDGTFTETSLNVHLITNATAARMNIADLNGDGIPDQLVTLLNSSGWYSYPAFGRGDGTFTEPFLNTHLVTNATGAQMNIVDLNGDGIPDQLVTLLNSSGWYSYPAFGRGDGTFTEPFLNTHLVTNATGAQMNIVDLNGDGIPDQLVTQLGTSGWYSRPAFGKGDGTFAEPTLNTHLVANVTGSQMNIVDLNGDGIPDQLVTQLGTSGWYSRPALGKAKKPFLGTVSTGSLTTATISLRTLSALPSIYVKDVGVGACTHPCLDLQGPLYVVSEVKSSNGTGGEYRSTYRYAGAKADQHGRGFLGFRQMTVRDEQTGVEQVTSYRQDYPFAGLVASREKKLGAQLLNRSTNTYGVIDLGGTRRYPFLTQSLEESWELSGAALPAVTTSYQYDAFGNATQVGVSTGDGHSKTTVNTYSNDTANWLLGRLTRSEVTSTTPVN